MKTLYQAASDGDVRLLESLLESGADIEQRGGKANHTPLMAACLSEAAGADAVLFLLERGADIHAREVLQPVQNAALFLEDPEVNEMMRKIAEETASIRQCWKISRR